MNIQEVKAAIPGFQTQVQFDKGEISTETTDAITGQTKTEISHIASGWINEGRIRLLMGLELFKKLASGEPINNLAFKVKDKISGPNSKTPSVPYKLYSIFQYKEGTAGAL